MGMTAAPAAVASAAAVAVASTAKAARVGAEKAVAVMAVAAVEGWMAVEAAEEAPLLVWRVGSWATVATEAEPKAEAPLEAAGWAAVVQAEKTMAAAAAAPVAMVRGACQVAAKEEEAPHKV